MRRRLLMSAALIGMVVPGCTGTGTVATSADVSVDSQSSSTTVITATVVASSTTTTEISTTTTVAVADTSDGEWPVTIVLDLESMTFTAVGTDVEDGLFCPDGSATELSEERYSTTYYWEVELMCGDGSGSFVVSADSSFGGARYEEWRVVSPDTGAWWVVENSGWWRIDSALGDYEAVKQVDTVGYQELAGGSDWAIQTFYSDLSTDDPNMPDEDWPVTIAVDRVTETFTAEGSDIDDGLFCPVGSVHVLYEDSSYLAPAYVSGYQDYELRCEDGSGSFTVSTASSFELDEDGEMVFEDSDTGEVSFVANSGWWIVEDADGDYTGVTNVQSVGYQRFLPGHEIVNHTMYGRLKRSS